MNTRAFIGGRVTNVLNNVCEEVGARAGDDVFESSFHFIAEDNDDMHEYINKIIQYYVFSSSFKYTVVIMLCIYHTYIVLQTQDDTTLLNTSKQENIY